MFQWHRPGASFVDRSSIVNKNGANETILIGKKTKLHHSSVDVSSVKVKPGDKANGGANATSSSQLPIFDPKDLDGSKTVPCGFEKCFFRSKSDSSIGYLVAKSRGESKTLRRARLKALESAYKYAMHLEREYGIRHFLLEPPLNITVDKQLASHLNRNLKSETHRNRFRKNRRFPKGATVVVEKCERAPSDSFLIGCKESKLALFKKTVQKFVERVENKTTFARHLQESFVDLRELVQQEPCLLNDFQVLIDTKGNMYHLDFDRCFNTRTSKKKKGVSTSRVNQTSCFKNLEVMERRVYQALDNLAM